MRTDEFDALVKNEFDHNDFEYDPGHWDKINAQLHGRKTKALFILKPVHGIAAGIALLCATAFLYTTFKKPAAVVTVAPAQHSQPIAQTNTVAAAHSVTNAPATPAVAKQPVKPRGAAIAMAAPAKRQARQAAYSRSSAIVAATENALTNNEGLTDHNNTNSILSQHTQEVKTDMNLGKTPALKTLPPHTTTLYAANDEQEKKSKKISLNLTGGLNYGSANAGYAVGGNAMASISRKFYVEGDIAFINGSRSTTTTNYYNAGETPGNGFTTGSVNAVKAPVYESINHSRTTNYLQFAPAVGYRILKNMSIGVGADIERLLDYDAVTEATPSGDMKVLPEIDFGLTAKTEYRLNKRLKAGLQYREGINNVLGGGGKYVDRNYFQVQVKFNILER